MQFKVFKKVHFLQLASDYFVLTKWRLIKGDTLLHTEYNIIIINNDLIS